MHMQMSMCVQLACVALEGHVALDKMVEISLKFRLMLLHILLHKKHIPKKYLL